MACLCRLGFVWFGDQSIARRSLLSPRPNILSSSTPLLAGVASEKHRSGPAEIELVENRGRVAAPSARHFPSMAQSMKARRTDSTGKKRKKGSENKHPIASCLELYVTDQRLQQLRSVTAQGTVTVLTRRGQQGGGVA